jgi:hypothetical protein
MSNDRFVAETIASQPDLEQRLGALGPDGSRVLELLSEMSPMALMLLLAKGAGDSTSGAAGSGGTHDVLEEVVRRAAERNGFDEQHVREAMVLLRNGTFERDLAMVVAETSRAVGQMPAAVARSVRRTLANPLRVFGFMFAVVRDLKELPFEAGGLSHREFERLMRGGAAGPDREYPLFDHTFEALYQIEPISVLKDWVLEVTARESVQLALIVYARTQGVEIQKADIEAARRSFAQGNLTPALVQGIDYFRREHADRFPEVLGMLA